MIQGTISIAILSFLLGQSSAAARQSRPAGIGLEEYSARRDAVSKAIGEDAIFILRGEKEPRGVWNSRQNSNFYYLTGVEDGGVILMLDPGGEETEILFLPRRNRAQERWNGPRLYPGEEAEAATGMATTRPISEYDDHLAKRAARKKVIYYNYQRVGLKDSLPADLETILRLQLQGGHGFRGDPIRLAHCRSVLNGLRQVKSEAEVGLLQKAISITCNGLREAMRSVHPGQYEYQLQAALEYVFKRSGAERAGFSSIVGSGPNSCVLHYRDNKRRMEEGDLVVVDVGAEYEYYTADVTRTFPVSGKFTPRQREIYEIVLRAQNEAFKEVRPGNTIGDVHKKAREIIDRAGYGKYFIHGTSHWLGLDVHDVGERGRKLEPGMLLTVEPGIYIPEEEIGIRIEDDVLVTEEGYLQLSASLPRDPDSIEEIQAKRGMADAPQGVEKRREM